MLRPLILIIVALLILTSVSFVSRSYGQGIKTIDKGELETEEELGSYENSALVSALKMRELLIEENPEGKVLGAIHVVNLDVFGEEVGILKWLNVLHVTTREQVIRRNVLLRTGEMWQAKVVEETMRELKDPLFTSLVVIRPVQASASNTVDLLVVTRDIWSLRLNSSFEYLQGKLTQLRISTAENNILGLRKHGALALTMDQSKISLGPQYLDKSFLGSKFQLRSRANIFLGRESKDFEGTGSSNAILYPIWSLRQKWGGGIKMSHFDSVVRSFRGTEVEKIDDVSTEEVEEVPWIYNFKNLTVESHLIRSFGSDVKQRVTAGHRFSLRRPEVMSNFRGTQAEINLLKKVAFPRSERESSLFVEYQVRTPNYKVYRNLNSYDLAEDVRLGPSLTLGASMALKVLGSEQNFYRANIGASWTLSFLGDGYLRVSTGARTRLQDGEGIDNVVENSIAVASPRLFHRFRMVGQSRLGIRLRERGNSRYTLGDGSGLRGYVISEFSGQKRFVTNVEIRSLPLKVLFARVGGLVFWDFGHVADRLGDLKMKHGVGFGLRYLVPQLQPVVFRLDWAFPLQGASAGWPGRISAGVAQVF